MTAVNDETAKQSSDENGQRCDAKQSASDCLKNLDNPRDLSSTEQRAEMKRLILEYLTLLPDATSVTNRGIVKVHEATPLTTLQM